MVTHPVCCVQNTRAGILGSIPGTSYLGCARNRAQDLPALLFCTRRDEPHTPTHTQLPPNPHKHATPHHTKYAQSIITYCIQGVMYCCMCAAMAVHIQCHTYVSNAGCMCSDVIALCSIPIVIYDYYIYIYICIHIATQPANQQSSTCWPTQHTDTKQHAVPVKSKHHHKPNTCIHCG